MDRDGENQLAIFEQFASVPVTKETISSPEFGQKYEYLTSLIQVLEQAKRDVDAKIKEVMKDAYFQSGEGSIVSGNKKYSYIPATTKESFDAKRLKSEDPELYRKYVYISSVKDSLRVTTNGPKEAVEGEENVIATD